MLLLIAAVLAAPPPGLNLDDVDAWEADAFSLTHGPKGDCWELSGGLSAQLALYAATSVFDSGGTETLTGQGTFSGRIEDGVWTRFTYTMASPEDDTVSMDLPVLPLSGHIDPGIITNTSVEQEPKPEPAAEATADEGDGESRDGTSVSINKEEDGRSVSVSIGAGDPGDSINLLRDAIDEWFSAAITTSYMRWSDERGGAELVIEVPTSEGWFSPELTATAFFPGGGRAATELDAIFPKRLTIGEWPLRAKIMDGQMHLRGQVIDGLLLPSQESWSALLGVAGFTIGYEQRLIYSHIQECRR